MKANIKSFEDLDVYKKLCELHLQISKISLSFPKFELHELGSQIRRSSPMDPDFGKFDCREYRGGTE